MQEIINQIKKLKRTKIKKEIDNRIKEFKTMNSMPNKAWFCELCFCLMTANWKAQESIQIQKDIDTHGFCTWNIDKLSKTLKEKGHRFWPQRAKRIVLARKYINIKDILKKEKEPRKWLADNIKGLGYKESSHFLRNVGYTNYAIIDRHIINLLSESNIITKPKTITPKRYIEIEDKLKEIGNKVKLNQAELDLYLWYIKTGKILK